MRMPWTKRPTPPAQALPTPPPADPLTVEHYRLNGPDALKCFTWLTLAQRDKDLAARCRLWQHIHALYPETRAGNWEIAIGLVDLIVYRRGA